MELPRAFKDILDSIEENLRKGRPLPALILIYTAIDNISYLTCKVGGRGRSIFKKWVKEWMLKAKKLPCDETDIYSARCGLLHNQSAESDLTEDGTAKQLWYTYGTADVSILNEVMNHNDNHRHAIPIRIEDIKDALKQGLIDSFNAMEHDEELLRAYKKRSDKVFGTIRSNL